MGDDDGPPELGYVEDKKEKEDEDFDTFDANGDGLLDFDEIVTYFTASFFAEGKGECEREHGLTPGEMAEDMAYNIHYNIRGRRYRFFHLAEGHVKFYFTRACLL